jgi:hypothetical protein
MPSYGQKQIPAGKKCKCSAKPMPGHRSMNSRDKNIISDLSIDNIPYKGNVVLRANQ